MPISKKSSRRELIEYVRKNNLPIKLGKKAQILQALDDKGHIHTGPRGSNPDTPEANTPPGATPLEKLKAATDRATASMTPTPGAEMVEQDLSAITMASLFNLGFDVSQNIYSRTLAGRVEAGEAIPYDEVKQFFKDRKDEGGDFEDEFYSSMEGREQAQYGQNNEYYMRLTARIELPDASPDTIEMAVQESVEGMEDDEWQEDNEDTMRVFREVQQEDFEQEEEAHWKQTYDRHIRGNRYSNVTGMTDAFEKAYINL